MLYICYFSNALKYISTSTITLGRNPWPDEKNIPPIQKKLLLNYGCDASSQFPLVHQIISQVTQPTCMASDYQIIILLKLHQSQSYMTSLIKKRQWQTHLIKEHLQITILETCGLLGHSIRVMRKQRLSGDGWVRRVTHDYCYENTLDDTSRNKCWVERQALYVLGFAGASLWQNMLSPWRSISVLHSFKWKPTYQLYWHL